MDSVLQYHAKGKQTALLDCFTKNLYKHQWLEIAFKNRKKADGVYALSN